MTQTDVRRLLELNNDSHDRILSDDECREWNTLLFGLEHWIPSISAADYKMTYEAIQPYLVPGTTISFTYILERRKDIKYSMLSIVFSHMMKRLKAEGKVKKNGQTLYTIC